MDDLRPGKPFITLSHTKLGNTRGFVSDFLRVVKRKGWSLLDWLAAKHGPITSAGERHVHGGLSNVAYGGRCAPSVSPHEKRTESARRVVSKRDGFYWAVDWLIGTTKSSPMLTQIKKRLWKPLPIFSSSSSFTFLILSLLAKAHSVIFTCPISSSFFSSFFLEVFLLTITFPMPSWPLLLSLSWKAWIHFRILILHFLNH